jgi:hypothetical protein
LRDGCADETRDPRDQIGHLAGLPCCQLLPEAGAGLPIAWYWNPSVAISDGS